MIEFTANQNQTTPAGYNALPTNAKPAIHQPPVPYIDAIPGGLRPGSQIFITGTPNANANRFEVNLKAGPDIAFHFNPRFHDRIVVANSCRSGNWDNEERQSHQFPFMGSATFDLLIACDSNQLKVAVNGQHFITFAHRIPFQYIDAIEVRGDLRLQQIQPMA